MVKYETKRQKVVVAIIGTPFYLLLILQLVKVFNYFNPGPTLY